MSQPAGNTAPEGTDVHDVLDEQLAIAGSGTIACGLAATAAAHGMPVLLWARSPGSAAGALERIAADCGRLEADKDAERVTTTTNLADLSRATLVIESVREEEDVKRPLLASLDRTLPEQAMIATTTSSLEISMLSAASGRPSRFFGLHVFNPVPRMKLVELCFPPQASEETRGRARAFCEAVGKSAVEVPDQTGFVVNRLLFPYLFDAVRLLERTGLRPEQVDACMKLGASHPMGPLELLDLVGIDVAEAIGEALYADSGDAAHRPPGRIKELVRSGRLGRKTGSGFYSYA
jgi:3-hydroxybutyryl-CoA dehydrogenase